MPFYAELDENNIVIRVIKFGEGDTPQSMGFEADGNLHHLGSNIQASPGFRLSKNILLFRLELLLRFNRSHLGR